MARPGQAGWNQKTVTSLRGKRVLIRLWRLSFSRPSPHSLTRASGQPGCDWPTPERRQERRSKREGAGAGEEGTTSTSQHGCPPVDE
jgi:hypothetical protein